MSDILDEIREDLFKEKFTLFWRKYAKYFFIFIAFLVLLPSSYIIYDNYQLNKSYHNTEKLYEIIDSYNNNDENSFINLSKEFVEDGSNLSQIAIIKKIQLDIKNNHIYEAYNDLKSFINQKNSEKLFKDYAILLINFLTYKYSNYDFIDKNNYVELESDNIFYFSILEIRSLGYIENNKFDLAVNELLKITKSDSAPQINKNFALELINLLEKSEKI
ncbi:MAG: hypothetical protein ISP24_00765 [Rickettsiales bacterium]|nr:hypothetical protein [Rickettsiales bacterium]